MYIFTQIILIKKQPVDVQTPALSSMKFSAWGLLPENFLYSLVASDDIQAREIGLRKIIGLRKDTGRGIKGKGKGKKPKRTLQLSHTRFQFDCLHWYELVDLDIEGVAECPLTQNIPLQEIENALLNGTALLQVPTNFPAHSQSVERCVKLVTEASSHVFDFEQRHRHIHTVVMSRAARPMFDNKGDYIQIYEKHLK